MKRFFSLCLALLLVLPCAAQAIESTAYTYTLSVYGDFIRTQDAYMPGSVMLRELGLKSPEDLYLLGRTMYIADTGNARVLRYDMASGVVTVIGQGVLKQPTGVCAGKNGEIYIADYGAQAICCFSADGQLIQTILRPEDSLYGASTAFKPQKVDIDAYGNLFVTSEGTHEGILQFDTQGAFAGFFGANKVEGLTLTQRLTDLIYSKEQKDKQARRNPPRIVNLCVSQDNLVYSLTQFSPRNAVKKLNMAGINILGTYPMYADNNVVDVAVAQNNVFYTVTATGNIVEHNAQGQLMFAFGGRAVSSDRNGLTSVVSAICLDSDHNLYVLDKQRGVVQPYAATDFARSIHQALDDYADGRYADAAEIWQEFIRLTPMAMFAHAGYGLALWQTGDYSHAKAELEIAMEMTYASEAFWEIRNRWLMEHLSLVIIILASLLAAVWLLSLLNQRYGIFKPAKRLWVRVSQKSRAVTLVRTMGALVRHPLDTFYDLRHDLRGSVAGASVLYCLAFLVFMLDSAFTATLFNTRLLTTPYANPYLVAGIVLIPSTLFVVGNYFIASINDGEGSFRHVYIALGYALSFYILLTPLTTLLSYVLTMNEAFLLTLLRLCTLLYTVVLIYLAAKEVHGYNFRQTLKNLLLTLCFVVLTLVAMAILYILWKALYDFCKTLFEEVRLRA